MASILPSYMAGLKVAFAVSIAAAGLGFCLSPFNNFGKINAHADAADSPTGAVV
jgi:MFS transporter, DHA2 family, glioxin efflux transporter